MTYRPIFPTILHQDTAELVRDYFLITSNVDTVLVVNSCARGQAVPESDLDFAILENQRRHLPKLEI
jgi:predicted nucleotidyltransferase